MPEEPYRGLSLEEVKAMVASSTIHRSSTIPPREGTADVICRFCRTQVVSMAVHMDTCKKLAHHNFRVEVQTMKERKLQTKARAERLKDRRKAKKKAKKEALKEMVTNWMKTKAPIK